MDNKILLIGYIALLVFALFNSNRMYEHMEYIPVEQHIAAGMVNAPQSPTDPVYTWNPVGPNLPSDWKSILNQNTKLDEQQQQQMSQTSFTPPAPTDDSLPHPPSHMKLDLLSPTSLYIEFQHPTHFGNYKF